MMFIARITVKNFRRLKHIDVPLSRHTVLIGENNAGKSSLLELLDVALNPTRRAFFLDEHDFTHGLDPNTAQVEAVIEFRPWSGALLGTAERVAFDPHIDVLPDGSERVLLRLEHYFDSEDGSFRTRLRFIKSDGQDDGFVSAADKRRLPCFVIPALRSATRDLTNRGGTWARMVSGVKLEPTQREEIGNIAEKAATDIMPLILGNQAFSETTERLTELLSSVLWSGDGTGELQFSALPSDERELLQAVQILLKNPGDIESVGILNHGDGTQSIAVIALMLAYIKALGFPEGALAVEEPEAHLHPHAIRSLTRYLWDQNHQVIITTHSTHVTDVVDPSEVVLLKRRGAETVARFVPHAYFSDNELRELFRHIHTVGSEFFFAKCVLLVEGPSETAALPIFAQALGIKPDQLGVSLVSVGGQLFRPFMRLFDPKALDTSYLIMCDNDKAAVAVANVLNDLGLLPFRVQSATVESKRTDLETKGLYFLPKGDFEEYVMSEGHVAAFEEAIGRVHGADRLDSYVKTRAASEGGYEGKSREQQILDFIDNEKGKPELAFEVANIITQEGKDPSKVPPYFTKVLKAVELAAKKQTAT